MHTENYKLIFDEDFSLPKLSTNNLIPLYLPLFKFLEKKQFIEKHKLKY